MERIAASLGEGFQPDAIVLGLPDESDARAVAVAREVRLLGGRLERFFGVPVHYQDEQFSSRRAEELLRTAGKRGRTEVDAAAACVILQDFLRKQGDLL